MKTSEKLVWQVYSGLLGALTTLIAQQAMTRAWKLATGEEPPNPNDPDVPFSEAITWAVATGIGVGVTQLSMNRYMSRRWQTNMGRNVPKTLRNRLTD